MNLIKLSAAILLTLAIGFSLMQFAQAEEAKDGKTIFIDAKCTACHSIDSQGVEAKKKTDKTPDLSKLTEGHDIEFWTKYLKKEESLNSKKHAMPFKGSDEDLQIMLEWLMSLGAE